MLHFPFCVILSLLDVRRFACGVGGKRIQDSSAGKLGR